MTPPLDERIAQVSERNPSALTTLQAASKELPKNEFEAFLDELEALHITGPRVWLGFNDHCDQDIECFIDAVREQDEDMVALINEQSYDDKPDVPR